MGTSKEFAEYFMDQLTALGEITPHRMFGAYGIKYGNVNFALLIDDLAYFRVDDETRPLFEEMGSQPFRYKTKRGEVTVASYYEVPTDYLEEPDRLISLARKAVDAALRSPTSTKKRKRKPVQ